MQRVSVLECEPSGWTEAGGGEICSYRVNKTKH